MQNAVDQAHKAFEQNEVPIGAVVVDASGVIIAQAYNQVEALGTQRAHAEMIAIEAASSVVGNWRLNNCWLYVTLEPCAMCMGFAQLSRLAGVVYGARSPRFGYSRENILHEELHQQKNQLFGQEVVDRQEVVDKQDIVVKEGAIHTMLVIGGVKSEKSEQMLKVFFNTQRSKK